MTSFRYAVPGSFCYTSCTTPLRKARCTASGWSKSSVSPLGLPRAFRSRWLLHDRLGDSLGDSMTAASDFLRSRRGRESRSPRSSSNPSS